VRRAALALLEAGLGLGAAFSATPGLPALANAAPGAEVGAAGRAAQGRSNRLTRHAQSAPCGVLSGRAPCASRVQRAVPPPLSSCGRPSQDIAALEGATRDPLVRHREGRGRAEEWRVCA
jgi:hypothetical protein